jgi:hypothetical protein
MASTVAVVARVIVVVAVDAFWLSPVFYGAPDVEVGSKTTPDR